MRAPIDQQPKQDSTILDRLRIEGWKVAAVAGIVSAALAGCGVSASGHEAPSASSTSVGASKNPGPETSKSSSTSTPDGQPSSSAPERQTGSGDVLMTPEEALKYGQTLFEQALKEINTYGDMYGASYGNPAGGYGVANGVYGAKDNKLRPYGVFLRTPSPTNENPATLTLSLGVDVINSDENPGPSAEGPGMSIQLSGLSQQLLSSELPNPGATTKDLLDLIQSATQIDEITYTGVDKNGVPFVGALMRKGTSMEANQISMASIAQKKQLSSDEVQAAIEKAFEGSTTGTPAPLGK